MRRIVLVLSLTAVMVVMLAVPAFAAVDNTKAFCSANGLAMDATDVPGEIANAVKDYGGLGVAYAAGPHCPTG